MKSDCEEQRATAYELYLQGKKYQEIAETVGVTVSCIKSWASRYWKQKKSQPTKKKVAVAKKVATKNKDIEIKELSIKEIETLANNELTEEQRLFCLYYSKSFNATRAYLKAYNVDYRTAQSNGCRLLTYDYIKDEIMKLKQERYAQSMLTKDDIFQKYMDIAFADITDFIEFGNDTNNGNAVSKNYVRFKDDEVVDGTLISEVKQGKDGASIKLSDRMKALQWLSDHMGWATELQRAQLEQIQAQTSKLKSDADNKPDDNIQQKMDAIDGILAQMQPPEDNDL